MRALLDINVVTARLDGGYGMHRAASVWMERQLEQGWATTAITQNGVIRIMSQPSYPNHRSAAEVAERVAEACNHASHLSWGEEFSLLEAGLIQWNRVLGPRQITDCSLLAFAAKWGGPFVSFDQRIRVDLVPGARPDHLETIPVP
ncbi:MAG: VapC toxin family PIN domain ribonuclease [Synechococcus sp. ELA057]